MALELQRLDDPCPLWRPSGLTPAAPAPAHPSAPDAAPSSPVGARLSPTGAGPGRAYVAPGADGLMIRPVHPAAREERAALCARFR